MQILFVHYSEQQKSLESLLNRLDEVMRQKGEMERTIQRLSSDSIGRRALLSIQTRPPVGSTFPQDVLVDADSSVTSRHRAFDWLDPIFTYRFSSRPDNQFVLLERRHSLSSSVNNRVREEEQNRRGDNGDGRQSPTHYSGASSSSGFDDRYRTTSNSPPDADPAIDPEVWLTNNDHTVVSDELEGTAPSVAVSSSHGSLVTTSSSDEDSPILSIHASSYRRSPSYESQSSTSFRIERLDSFTSNSDSLRRYGNVHGQGGEESGTPHDAQISVSPVIQLSSTESQRWRTPILFRSPVVHATPESFSSTPEYVNRSSPRWRTPDQVRSPQDDDEEPATFSSTVSDDEWYPRNNDDRSNNSNDENNHRYSPRSSSYSYQPISPDDTPRTPDGNHLDYGFPDHSRSRSISPEERRNSVNPPSVHGSHRPSWSSDDLMRDSSFVDEVSGGHDEASRSPSYDTSCRDEHDEDRDCLEYDSHDSDSSETKSDTDCRSSRSSSLLSSSHDELSDARDTNSDDNLGSPSERMSLSQNQHSADSDHDTSSRVDHESSRDLIQFNLSESDNDNLRCRDREALGSKPAGRERKRMRSTQMDMSSDESDVPLKKQRFGVDNTRVVPTALRDRRLQSSSERSHVDSRHGRCSRPALKKTRPSETCLDSSSESSSGSDKTPSSKNRHA